MTSHMIAPCMISLFCLQVLCTLLLLFVSVSTIRFRFSLCILPIQYGFALTFIQLVRVVVSMMQTVSCILCCYILLFCNYINSWYHFTAYQTVFCV